jgi:uncharacterized protein
MKHIEFEGPTGRIEGLFDDQKAAVSGAVICHPHPLYGGSMYDAVVEQIHLALVAAGIATLRINFRGVGNSTGEHDRGRGEVDDLLGAINWLEGAGKSVQLIAGYSFGAIVALNALQRSTVAKAILVAPPVMMMDTVAPSIPTLAILGETDQIVAVVETARFFERSTVWRIPGSDHFFAGAGADIQKAIRTFIDGA